MNSDNENWKKRPSAARYLGVSIPVLKRLEVEGRIKYVRIPSKHKNMILYKDEWLDEFKKEYTVEITT